MKDIKDVLRRVSALKKTTTFLTYTRRGANKINGLVVQELFESKTQKNPDYLGEVPGHYDANPDNYDAQNKLIAGRRPEPKMVQLYKGMRLRLTHNENKKEDFVNGMEVVVEDYLVENVKGRKSKCLQVVTETGKRLSVHLHTEDPLASEEAWKTRVTFFPIRYGYAATLHKAQGATLEHATIWLDGPTGYMKAAGHVALSRVQYDEDYLLGA